MRRIPLVVNPPFLVEVRPRKRGEGPGRREGRACVYVDNFHTLALPRAVGWPRTRGRPSAVPAR